jgi:hypothetical protein
MSDRLGDMAEQDDHESDDSDEDGLENEDEREDELESEEAVRNAIAQLEAGAQQLDLSMMVGDAGAAALATVLTTNMTLGS